MQSVNEWLAEMKERFENRGLIQLVGWRKHAKAPKYQPHQGKREQARRLRQSNAPSR
jgi:hypothetical protein